MRDYGFEIRQKFIAESKSLYAKREDIKQRIHAEGKALVGEELLAEKLGLKLYDAKAKWGGK